VELIITAILIVACLLIIVIFDFLKVAIQERNEKKKGIQIIDRNAEILNAGRVIFCGNCKSNDISIRVENEENEKGFYIMVMCNKCGATSNKLKSI